MQDRAWASCADDWALPKRRLAQPTGFVPRGSSGAGDLAASLLHELKQPLAALTNYLEAARQMLGQGDSRPAELVTLAAEQAWWAASLVGSISRAAADEPLERARNRASEVLHEAVRLACAGADAGSIDIVVAIHPGGEWLVGDRVALQQVIVNLVRNAAEAIADNAGERRVVVEVLGGQTGVELHVSDTGRGIAPSFLPFLFEPFATTKPGPGRGMGLALSQRIAEAHGGCIRAHNRAGGGACFRLFLPE